MPGVDDCSQVIKFVASTSLSLCTLLQFESIANFGAVIDRLGEFQEVLESSAMSRAPSTDAAGGSSNPAGQQSLIQLVDQPGACPALCVRTKNAAGSTGMKL